MPTTGTRQQKPLHMAWEWELRDTCQASVLYDALGDSMLSWSAADGAPTDLGDGVGEFWALTDGSLGARLCGNQI